jgi:hypothetical protein
VQIFDCWKEKIVCRKDGGVKGFCNQRIRDAEASCLCKVESELSRSNTIGHLGALRTTFTDLVDDVFDLFELRFSLEVGRMRNRKLLGGVDLILARYWSLSVVRFSNEGQPTRSKSPNVPSTLLVGRNGKKGKRCQWESASSKVYRSLQYYVDSVMNTKVLGLLSASLDSTLYLSKPAPVIHAFLLSVWSSRRFSITTVKIITCWKGSLRRISVLIVTELLSKIQHTYKGILGTTCLEYTFGNTRDWIEAPKCQMP